MKQKEENIENNEGFNINNENIINNTNKIKNRFMEIFNYRKELNLSKKVKRFHLFNKECKNPSDEKIIYKLGKIFQKFLITKLKKHIQPMLGGVV